MYGAQGCICHISVGCMVKILTLLTACCARNADWNYFNISKCTNASKLVTERFESTPCILYGHGDGVSSFVEIQICWVVLRSDVAAAAALVSRRRWSMTTAVAVTSPLCVS